MKKVLFTLFLFISIQSFGQSGCFEVQSILVDACAPSGQEGLNEMVRFQVGNQALSVNDMNVTWATTNNAWEGVCQSPQTAALVNQLNSTIIGCGILVEPTNGVLPANSQVLLISSISMDPGSNSFAGLNDTLYIIFHCAINTTGNFANYNSAGGPRTLTMSFSNPGGGCSDVVTYDRGLLVNQGGQAGAQDGATVNFSPEGEAEYVNNGCAAPFNAVVADWNAPASVCQGQEPINLDALVSSNPGGTWTGEGVTGNVFNPSGLSGDISITYSVQVNTCLLEVTKEITVFEGGDASWTSPQDICSGSQAIDLTQFITGDIGGVFFGNGVVGDLFNPSGLIGPVAVTYSIGAGDCASLLTNTINVVEGGDASWSFTSDIICESTDAIVLDLLVTGQSGGTWSGQGVTGNVFNPDGLSGEITITYTIEGTDCGAAVSDTITISSAPDASFDLPEYICTTEGDFNLNDLVTGTAGGTWSGEFIENNIFNSQGNPGSYTITYFVGVTGCSNEASQILSVLPAPSAPSIVGSPNYCIGGPFPEFTSTAGENTTWYGDAGLNEVLSTGTNYQVLNDANPVLFATGFSAGCISETAQIELNLINPTQLLASTNGSDQLCPGSSILLSGVTNNGNISWSTGSNQETIEVFEPGLYIVTANGFCNTEVDTIEIFDAAVTVQLAASPLEGPEILNVTVQGTSVNSDNCVYLLNGLEVSPDLNGVISIPNEGNYTITYTCSNQFGCEAETSVSVVVLTDDIKLEFANSFTPNGDGFNDFFKAQASALNELKVTIFNRWGQQVATWDGIEGFWDGTSSSGEVPDGVYFYVADAKDILGNDLNKNGSINLLR